MSKTMGQLKCVSSHQQCKRINTWDFAEHGSEDIVTEHLKQKSSEEQTSMKGDQRHFISPPVISDNRLI